MTRPENGRFELLIQANAGLKSGEQLKFIIDALGPGKTLTTSFLADVVQPLSPRKLSQKLQGGAQRKPPYALVYITRDDWALETCWGNTWTGADPGSFDPPSAKSPLTIFINTETDLLTGYRDALLSKKLAEATIQQRINKYTAHVAFHLYQMYLKKKEAENDTTGESKAPTEEQMRDEIKRVAMTLIKLMEVAQ